MGRPAREAVASPAQCRGLPGELLCDWPAGILAAPMKILLTISALLALVCVASAKPGWLDNFNRAKAQAKAENKRILLDFTGSDWCPNCKTLAKEVFSQKEFQAYAAKNLVLMEVDFPQFRLPESVKNQNEQLKAKYKVEVLPTLVVLDSSGRKL